MAQAIKPVVLPPIYTEEQKKVDGLYSKVLQDITEARLRTEPQSSPVATEKEIALAVQTSAAITERPLLYLQNWEIRHVTKPPTTK